MTEPQTEVSPLASQQHRLAATAVDSGLFWATCMIGWIVWTLILWSKGQTPGKYLLKIRVLNEPTGTPATWGQMFIRQQLIGWALVAPYLIAYLFSILNPNTSGWFGLIVGYLLTLAIYFLFLAVYIVDVVWAFGPTRRRLVDYWAGTIVVNEANLLKPQL
jgi:uncharacterized RDD family membrane protein YckC